MTTEVKPQTHTQGPWEVNGDRDSDEGLTVEARGGEVAFIATTTGYARADIANARLIAAAPELLSALTELHDASDIYACSNGTMASHHDSYERFEAALDRAQAAIAKATGGEQ